MFSFRQLFGSNEPTNRRRIRRQSEPLESRAMLTGLAAGEALQFESGDTSRWDSPAANELVVDGSSTRGDANGFFDVFTELAPSAPVDDFTGLELQGGQEGAEIIDGGDLPDGIGPSGEDVRRDANGFFDVFTGVAPTDQPANEFTGLEFRTLAPQITIDGQGGSDTVVDPNDLVLRGLASIPLGIIDIGDLPDGIIDIGDLPDGIGPSGEDLGPVADGDANGFFDVFTELQAQLAGQEGQEATADGEPVLRGFADSPLTVLQGWALGDLNAQDGDGDSSNEASSDSDGMSPSDLTPQGLSSSPLGVDGSDMNPQGLSSSPLG